MNRPPIVYGIKNAVFVGKLLHLFCAVVSIRIEAFINDMKSKRRVLLN